MVMGPSCGMVLADLGADVIKIEPAPKGDNTRRLTGPAPASSRPSTATSAVSRVDMKKPAGLALVRRLADDADVVIENFRPGAMDKLGLGYAALARSTRAWSTARCKGFLPGPYEHRTALDEVVQMMGGLAYMTGPPGQPLRAGSSVNDIMGGMFAAIAILAALARARGDRARAAWSSPALFETSMVLVGQHMAQAAVEGRDPPTYGRRDISGPGRSTTCSRRPTRAQQVFVGCVTDTQWRGLLRGVRSDGSARRPGAGRRWPARCRAAAHPAARAPRCSAQIPKAELMARCEALGLPFAPIAKPADLFDDPHLLASGGLLLGGSHRDGGRRRAEGAQRRTARLAGVAPHRPSRAAAPAAARRPARTGHHARGGPLRGGDRGSDRGRHASRPDEGRRSRRMTVNGR